jgi:hypothetical protein
MKRVPHWLRGTLGAILLMIPVGCAERSPTDVAKHPEAPSEGVQRSLVASGKGTIARGGPHKLYGGPGSRFPVTGTIASGTQVTIFCTSRGTRETGPYGTTDLWDMLGQGKWISDSYVYTGTNNAVAPPCPAGPPAPPPPAPASAQPVLDAPWRGEETITQGVRAGFSHNVCNSRSYDRSDCNWENTWAIDVGLNYEHVLAPADGRVTSVKNTTSGGGRQIGLTVSGPGGAKFEMVFLHLSRIQVAMNQEVRRGQVIGVSGRSANNSEKGVPAHLHFHIYNPASKKSRDSATLPIEQLRLKPRGATAHRIYDARKGELNDPGILGAYSGQ